VLATTVDAAVWSLMPTFPGLSRPKYTVEPGFRWIKNPAGDAPVWLENRTGSRLGDADGAGAVVSTA